MTVKKEPFGAVPVQSQKMGPLKETDRTLTAQVSPGSVPPQQQNAGGPGMATVVHN